MNATAIARSIAGVVAVALASVAAAYPDKPVQYIIPFAAGGESDIAARLRAQAFSAKYKMEMIVVRKQVSDMMEAIKKDSDMRKKMFEGGFEVTDMSYERVPAFMKARTQEYLNSAKTLGLVK